ncbi:tetratricopeptide repeat protein [Caldichromatium japonicum]|uniref:Tetratricopeptide repeat protein n=1 Tax=Caldichromatium japonicum TaxID=2699430 RepID=A0A6G7VAJ1_9GAMM|nr:tetratricopeptide repeat-containing sulfotransferase family protein [Caldichromatium japonicum]QIK36807.1 tetratricopeptide repeat protein [Caldichromatium japonicum]
MSVEKTFASALAAHEAGRLEEAEEGYLKVLGEAPLHRFARNNLALILLARGEAAEAVERLEETVAIDPHFADAWNNLGSARAAAGDGAGACAALERATELGHASAPLNRARLAAQANDAAAALHYAALAYQRAPSAAAAEIAARAAGTLGDPALATWVERWFAAAPGSREAFAAVVQIRRGAASAIEQAARDHLAHDPDDALACNSLGVALHQQGREEEALAALERAIALAPQAAEPHNNRAVALKALGRLAEALAAVEQALALHPDYPEAHNTRGNILSAQERLAEALAAYEAALALRPDFIEAAANACLTLSDLERAEEALARVEALIAAHGPLPLLAKVQGIVLVRLERFAEAEAPLRRALASFPDDAEVASFLGSALHMLHCEGEAEELLIGTIPRLKKPVGALNALGNLYAALGRKEEAAETLKRAIAIEPNAPGLYRNLAGVYRFRRDDGYFQNLETLYARRDELKASDRVELLYALAEACDDVGEKERAMALFIEAGRARRALLDFDIAASERTFAQLQTVITRERFLSLHGCGYPSRLPVFILGMPRSGTTLMEQIIASHPKAFGAGELTLLADSLGFGLNIDGVHLDGMPPGLSDPDRALPIESGLFAWGERYVSALRRYCATAWRITDKMPGNFAKLPLIALAMPGVRIIHMRRHPLDTCLSCFKMRFTQGQDWSYDLTELGRYYSAYWRLMAHWRRVCPEAFIEVEYERLVADTESEARRVFDYLELPWDARCLKFYEHERPVHTASLAQVRQPIYTSAIGKWQAIAPQIAPLIAALDPEIRAAYAIPDPETLPGSTL